MVSIPSFEGERPYLLTVTERRPRHVHAHRKWPDGLTTSARFWIRNWRACMAGAEVVVVAQPFDVSPVTAPEVPHAR